MTLIRSLLGIALASALGAATAKADDVKLIFATLAPPDFARRADGVPSLGGSRQRGG